MKEKSFDIWNEKKKEIHFWKKKGLFVHAGEMWYIHIGLNIGYESIGKGNDFKRPFLIVKKLGNMLLGVSMTTKGKENKFYRKIDDKYFLKKIFSCSLTSKIYGRKKMYGKDLNAGCKRIFGNKKRVAKLLVLTLNYSPLYF